MTELVILAPSDAPDRPTSLDVGTAGPPDGPMVATSAVATWPRAVSLSWMANRPHDWSRVLEAIDRLGAPPLDGPPSSKTVEVPDAGFLSVSVLPHLGVTVQTLHGLDQTTVVVCVGRVEPSEVVRLLPVASLG